VPLDKYIHLYAHVSVEIPRPVHAGNGVMVYPLLKGEPLLRDTLWALTVKSQQQLAEQLGRFLHELHTVPFSGELENLRHTSAPVKRENWLDIQGRVKEKVYPLLLPHQVRWAERLFELALDNPEFFDYKPTLMHGDLAPYHILFSPQPLRICGVLDFGVAGVGDPATDIGNLLNSYGETFVTKMEVGYGDMSQHLARARFYAQAIELQWVLLGVETGKQFWFTAHLGGARDIG
jgi:aminoglycoside 2''-phosphotransferase